MMNADAIYAPAETTARLAVISLAGGGDNVPDHCSTK